MATLRVHKGSRGISVLAALIAINVLAAMGASLAVMVANNQDSRSQQQYADQAFYTTQAGLEFVLGQIYHGGNPCLQLDRALLGSNLLGNTIDIDRTGGKIYVVGTNGPGSVALSITDPIPPSQGQMLNTDTSQAQDSSNGAPPRKLMGVTFQLETGCGVAVTIDTMTVSWDPNNGEHVQQIKFDGDNVFSQGGSNGNLSGVLVDIENTVVADANVHTVDFIRWAEDIQQRLYTIVFTMTDNSTKTVTVDLR